MKIILQKSERVTNEEFFTIVKTNTIIDGIFLNVFVTKDNKMVIVNPSTEKEIFIPSFTLSELGYLNLLTLDDYLSRLSPTNKKIILNLIPAYLFDINDINIEAITENAKIYINIIKSIIDKYQSLNIYLCSRIQRTVYLIQEIIKDRNIGILLEGTNLTYIDVDFYIINTELLNFYIINQQLSLKKEVMILAPDEKDFELLKNFFNKSLKTPYDINTYSELQFITNYPNEFNEMFSKQFDLLSK